MKFLPILILSFFAIPVDQTKENDLDYLFEIRWVVNDNEGNIQEFENFNFVIYDSPQTANLPYHLRYAGLTFEKDGTLIEHVWNKCGTGNLPDHFKADFKIEEIGDESVIKISNSRIWDGEYIIVTLTDNNLKLNRNK